MNIQSLPRHREIPNARKGRREPDGHGKFRSMRIRDYLVLLLLILICFPISVSASIDIRLRTEDRTYFKNYLRECELKKEDAEFHMLR